jgi:integrase
MPSHRKKITVSVYTRERLTRKLRKATLKDDSPDTIFVLRYGTTWETLDHGIDFAHARISAIDKETALMQGKVTIPEPKARVKSPDALDALIDAYLKSIEEQRSHKTSLAYSLSLNAFYASCQCATVAEITEETLKKFIKDMKREHLSDRSIANRIANVVCFLRAHDSEISITHRYVEKTVKAYREDEIRAFFQACRKHPEMWLLFQFFLATGAREQEVMFAEYSDLDFKDAIFNVTAKAHWRPKDLAEREIPIPDYLIEALRERKKTATSKLIFPTPSDKVNGHMLRNLQAIVKEAELSGKWELHKWRKSYATLQSRVGVDVRTIQKRLGHSDIATTLAYLEGEDARSERSKDQVNETFASFAVDIPAAAEHSGV